MQPPRRPRVPDRQLDPVDLHLIFPPQWSPFQPFLSTPSLKAYLEGKGYRIRQSDWNVGFYRYFVCPSRVDAARARLRRYASMLPGEHAPYRAAAVCALATLDDYSTLRSRMNCLGRAGLCEDVTAYKESVEALQRLLKAFSTAEPVVDLGTVSLDAERILSSWDTLDEFTQDHGRNPFLGYFEQRILELCVPRYFGVSIIGAEQIVPGLTLCRALKQRFRQVPVVVGGSVFSRLVEKGSDVRRLFRLYFDYVCRYEGEQPLDVFLACDDPRREQTPNLAFLEDDEIRLTPLRAPLKMDEIPTPDFYDLPLKEYFSPQIVLPLLGTRGCYWGKCAFCYHGMIYQNRYRMRQPDLVAKDVFELYKRHGTRHFAFNDEALPPRLFRRLPEVIPPRRFYFTGLYRFEDSYTSEDFRRMYEVGFRSLYVGLESASERVQRHMRKNHLQSTMVSNLQASHDAGIWGHVFLFFGFPTETDEEAEETIRFLLAHCDIIDSEGTATFALEHNAAVYMTPERFGIREVRERPNRILEMCYEYDVVSGLGAVDAERFVKRFESAKESRRAYRTGGWIPREHLLLMLRSRSCAQLRDELARLNVVTPGDPSVSEVLSWFTLSGDSGTKKAKHFIVNRRTGLVCETNRDAVTLLESLPPDTALEETIRAFPTLAPLT